MHLSRRYTFQSGGSMTDSRKDGRKQDASDRPKDETPPTAPRPTNQNAPRTTKGKWTAPKFGSAGSGGAELEPGPERD